MKIVIPLSILAGLVMFFSSNFFAENIFHNSDLTIFLQLFSITIPLFAISQLLFGLIKAFEKISWYSAIVYIIQPISRVLVLLILLFIGLKEGAIMFSLISGFFITLLASYLFSKFYLYKYFINVKINKNKLTKELLFYSIPLMFSSVVMSILGWADTFLLGYLKDVESVGIYNVALPIAMLLSFVPLLFTQLFFPIINKEYSRNNINLIKELSKQISKWIFIINLPFLIIALFFPGVLINFLFGPQYFAGETALIFLAIGFFFSAQSELILNILGMLKKSKLRLLDILLALIIDIILCLLLIPKYGLSGAGFATMIAYIFYTILVFCQTYYYLKFIPARRKMFTIFISGLVSGVFLVIIKSMIKINFVNLIIAGISFLLFYTFLILITKSLDKNDIMIILDMRDRLLKWKKSK